MARREGRKTVALVGLSLPESLFWACGAVPISLGRLAWRVGADLGLPRDTCAAARTGFDLLVNHWIPAGLVDAVVLASGCDWSARWTDRLPPTVPVWSLNVSRAASARGATGGGQRAKQPPRNSRIDAQLGALEAMVTNLELLTDLPLTARAFFAAHERDMALEDLLDRLDRLRAEPLPALRAFEYYQVAGALDLADPLRWAAEVETLLESWRATRGPEATEVSRRGDSESAGGARVLLSGCPTGVPDPALIESIEQAGLQIVGDDFSFHSRNGTARERPRGGRRAILRWMAERLSIDEDRPAAGEQTPLAARLAARNADGVVWVHFRGCAIGAMETARLEASDLPVLVVEVEQVSPAPASLQTRLEAFRERLMATKTG